MTIDGGLRKLFSDNLPTFHGQPIETGGVGAGIPDWAFSTFGPNQERISGWVELKKTDAMAVQIDSFQVSWAEKNLRFGGRVFLAVRRQTTQGPRKGPATDALWLYHGSQTRRVSEIGLNHQDRLGYWPGPPRRWNWAEIRTILCS